MFMTPVGQSKYKDDIDPTLIGYTLSPTRPSDWNSTNNRRT